MASKKPKTILYRRKREGKTNYPKRLKLLLSAKPRLVVRLTNQKIIAQVVSFDGKGDHILAAVDSSSLKKHGWNYSCKNIPAAYLTGLLLGKVALEKGCREAVLDTGFRSSFGKGRLTAFLKGTLDAGMTIPHGKKEIFPDEERIGGKHVQDYARKVKENKKIYEKVFGGYLRSNFLPEKISEEFEKVKQKIIQKIEG